MGPINERIRSETIRRLFLSCHCLRDESEKTDKEIEKLGWSASTNGAELTSAPRL